MINIDNSVIEGMETTRLFSFKIIYMFSGKWMGRVLRDININ